MHRVKTVAPAACFKSPFKARREPLGDTVVLMPRLRLSLLIVGILVCLLALLVWNLFRPPAIVRLLPESAAIFYADLRPLRFAVHPDQHMPARSPDFQRFIDQTGIVPERDLDRAAFAINPRDDSSGPNGPVAWTEIFIGRFNTSRLERFVRSLNPGMEPYAGHTIFSIPIQPSAEVSPSRLLRVTVLRPGMIALSNEPTPEQIHLIIDHDRTPLPSPSPSLLTTYFPRIPRLAPAWGIGRIGLPFAEAGQISLFGLDLPIPPDQPMVLSLRYLSGLQLRIEAIAPSPDIALQQAGAISGLLSVARVLASAQPGITRSPMARAIDSVRVAPEGPRAVLTATVPLDLLRELASASPAP